MIDHRRGHHGIASAHDVALDVSSGDGGGIDIGDEVLNRFDPSEDFERGVLLFEDLERDGGGGDAADSLAGGGTTTTGERADAVFGIVGVVGMAGTVLGGHFIVGTGALIGIFYRNGDGCAESDAILDAGEDLCFVGLFAWCDDIGLARAAAVEGGLNDFAVDRNARWAAVDDHSYGSAVGFSVGVDAKCVAKSG